MASLTLKRDTPLRAMLRSLKIVMEGQQDVLLKYKQETTIDLPPGTYNLVAKMSWTKSNPLSVTLVENETKYVVAGCLPIFEAALNAYIPPFTCWTLKEI